MRAKAGNSGLPALPWLPWGCGLRAKTTGSRTDVQTQAETAWVQSLALQMGPAQQCPQEMLPRSTDKLVNFLCAISTPIR